MRHGFVVVSLCLAFGSLAWAEPSVGQSFPSFAVDDIGGASHTHRDLVGRWTVAVTMTDKDTGPALTAWYRRLSPVIPAGARLLTFCAVSLFPLIPTATVISQARESTPRSRWGEVWLSRNGDFADAMGLPESETPWVFVIDPSGRVVESVHATFNEQALARVTAVLARARTQEQGATARTP